MPQKRNVQLLLLLGLTLECGRAATALAADSSSLSSHLPSSMHGLDECRKWTIFHDPVHPGWPGHYVESPISCVDARPSGQTGGAEPKKMTIRAGQKTALRLELKNSVAVIMVTTLQDGVVGEVIRLRSTLSNSVLWGRVQPDGSVEMSRPPRTAGWESSRADLFE